ncbi:ABC transporter ATP-binding protein [Microbaculum marinum]|uniref:Spermidine/putrescine import ATP-binding protein PotA n=1 Tax=Microbaculum marinum TaxID=1764581 RepID=A0AAW9REH5_9HYPH
MMRQDSVIEVDGVTRRFGSLTAVDGVSLELGEGEFFALLGPSGCGKTTLLRLIAGFEIPDAGRILLDGNDITRLRPNRRPVNLMFQSYALFPHMTVRANIAYGLEMEKRPKDEIRSRVADILAMTELTALADRKPDKLSGGQRQRVALARALVKRPRVLLLDEPLGALDKKLREQMQLELKKLQHELGITFVVVTHDQDEALVMADRIALMKDGVIAQAGSPRELYENPASRFVAGFIGVTNFFEGRAADGGVIVDGHGLLQGTGATGIAAGERVALAVRPERIALSREAGLAGHNAVAGDIADLAYHGQDVNLLVRVDGVDRPVMVRLTAAEEEQGNFQPGQRVWCNWRPEHGRVLKD